ncbi:unnamed protein product, partial [Darwinula stevensoni]
HPHQQSCPLAFSPTGSEKCFTFPVPAVPEQRGRLHLHLTLQGYEAKDSESVTIMEYPSLVFVQTEKSLYLPGQTVRFRVLVLDAALKPLDDQVREVWVEDPSGTQTTRWKEPPSKAGFVQLQFQLAPESSFGNWMIKVAVMGRSREEAKQFEVSKYVLPKFSVDIQTPKVFYGDASTLDLNVCARYTNGGIVEGELSLRVEPSIFLFDYIRGSYPGFMKAFHINVDKYTPVIHHRMKGCHKASIPAEVLGMDDQELAPSAVNITAIVREKGTGVRFEESVVLDVERNPLDLDLHVSPTHFKPGFVYNGLV